MAAFVLCAGFRTPAPRSLHALGSRRPKSAKARNRGEGTWRRCRALSYGDLGVVGATSESGSAVGREG
jgi:hypothetical protein